MKDMNKLSILIKNLQNYEKMPNSTLSSSKKVIFIIVCLTNVNTCALQLSNNLIFVQKCFSCTQKKNLMRYLDFTYKTA